jgi:hypothetical protein
VNDLGNDITHFIMFAIVIMIIIVIWRDDP